MKTKKIISWAVALCMGVMLHSCDLDQKVFSSLTNANFPQTVEDIDALVVGMYANFKANSGGMWDDSNGGWAMPIYAAGDAGGLFGIYFGRMPPSGQPLIRFQLGRCLGHVHDLYH